MNQKNIGLIIILISVILGIFVYTVKENEDTYIQSYIEEQGTCFTEEGVCLHEKKNTNIYLGGGLTIALLSLGIYLIFFDKTQKIILKQHKDFSAALKNSKEDDKFKAFLIGFSESEQKVFKQIREQEGIKQSTLQFKTSISKTSLSLMLKDFEEKGYI